MDRLAKNLDDFRRLVQIITKKGANIKIMITQAS
jgi:DNA invertase Pin-like site-specific DNA recombinase